MTTARRYPPNRQLTWERLERGWSHDELCEQVKSCMRNAGEADTGLTGNTVRRWETGERRPDPPFRKHLVMILGKPASWACSPRMSSPYDSTHPNLLTRSRDC
jgi:transcriptional regulator with XRE-family HTH domain